MHLKIYLSQGECNNIGVNVNVCSVFMLKTDLSLTFGAILLDHCKYNLLCQKKEKSMCFKKLLHSSVSSGGMQPEKVFRIFCYENSII